MQNETIFDRKRQLFRQIHGTPPGSWEKFYEYLVVDVITTPPSTPNWEAQALFDAIQLSFDGSGAGGDAVAVDPYLVHNLAACARVVLEYGARDKIDWSNHDDILQRTYNGFAHTVINAIQKGQTKEVEGKVHLGHLPIPDYFIAMANTFELD